MSKKNDEKEREKQNQTQTRKKPTIKQLLNKLECEIKTHFLSVDKEHVIERENNELNIYSPEAYLTGTYTKAILDLTYNAGFNATIRAVDKKVRIRIFYI